MRPTSEPRPSVRAQPSPPPPPPVEALASPSASPSSMAYPAAAADVHSPDFVLSLSRVSGYAGRAYARCRPWSELLDFSTFSWPDSLSDACGRLRRNFLYFRVNYAVLLSAALAFSLLSNPSSLLLIACVLAGWCYFYAFRPADQPLVVLGRSVSGNETLAGLTAVTLLAFFATPLGSLIVSTLMGGAAAVLAHGVLRSSDDIFVDYGEAAGPPPSAAAAAPGPAIAWRVA